MRRLALLAVASLTSLALATPTLYVAASAAGQSSVVATPVVKKKPRIVELERAERRVQPGIKAQRITAAVTGGGTVKFTLRGTGIEKNVKVEVRRGKAVFEVPALGTGNYRVSATLGSSRRKTRFEVYDSALSITTTAYTISMSDLYRADEPPMAGSVRYESDAASTGFVDFYRNGNLRGGVSSPDFVADAEIGPGGTFTYRDFASRVANLYGAGTWTVQAFYTDGPEFSDYISSNLVVVQVNP